MNGPTNLHNIKTTAITTNKGSILLRDLIQSLKRASTAPVQSFCTCVPLVAFIIRRNAYMVPAHALRKPATHLRDLACKLSQTHSKSRMRRTHNPHRPVVIPIYRCAGIPLVSKATQFGYSRPPVIIGLPATPSPACAISKQIEHIATRFLKIIMNFCYQQSKYLAEIIVSTGVPNPLLN